MQKTNKEKRDILLNSQAPWAWSRLKLGRGRSSCWWEEKAGRAEKVLAARGSLVWKAADLFSLSGCPCGQLRKKEGDQLWGHQQTTDQTEHLLPSRWPAQQKQEHSPISARATDAFDRRETQTVPEGRQTPGRKQQPDCWVEAQLCSQRSCFVCSTPVCPYMCTHTHGSTAERKPNVKRKCYYCQRTSCMAGSFFPSNFSFLEADEKYVHTIQAVLSTSVFAMGLLTRHYSRT